MEFNYPQTKLIYLDLKSRYNKASLTKKELAHELCCSTSSIDLNISKGIGLPNYKKLGNAKNSRVVFNIIDVAEFLSQTIKVA